MMTSADFYQKGYKVAYIPNHAKGDLQHKDVEFGEVSSTNALLVFVKFNNGTTAKACDPRNLVLLQI